MKTNSIRFTLLQCLHICKRFVGSWLSWEPCHLGLDRMGGYGQLIFRDRTWSRGLVAIYDDKTGNGSIAKVPTHWSQDHSLSFLEIFCFHERIFFIFFSRGYVSIGHNITWIQASVLWVPEGDESSVYNLSLMLGFPTSSTGWGWLL